MEQDRVIAWTVRIGWSFCLLLPAFVVHPMWPAGFVPFVIGAGIAARLTRDRALFLALTPAISMAMCILVSLAVQLTVRSTLLTAILLALPALLGYPKLGGWDQLGATARQWVSSWRGWLVVLAAALWLWSVAIIDLDAAGSAGVIQVLPWQWFAALALVLVVWWHPAALALLCGMIVATVNLADMGAVMNTGYVHVGFAEAISDWGVLTGIDARFSWPGFLTAAGFIQQISGTTRLLIFYPAVIAMAYLPAVYSLAKTLGSTHRQGLLAGILFVCINWSAQDYYSPQSVALLLYMVVITLALRSEHEFVALTLAGAMVVSHQLTPVSLVVLLALLAALKATEFRTLWLGVGVLFASWFVFGATDWWSGNLPVLIEGFGKANEAVSAGFTERVQGEPLYTQMQRFRVLFTLALGAVAVVAWWRTKHKVVAAAVLAPVTLIFGQSYGGEVILRVFLYAAPFLAIMIARLRLQPVLVLAVCSILGFTARGVNVAFERTPADVVQAARFVLDRAPYGSTVGPLSYEGTLRMDRVAEMMAPPSPINDFVGVLAQQPDVVFLTTTRQHYERMVKGYDQDFRRVAEELETYSTYKITWESEHVVVLERTDVDGVPLGDSPGVWGLG
ncbi:hypothetical protein [Corynebacterium sp.]|uniref:hypothetical protein n=1 Tax=Corynebacterium sp. TaxID=1720 RepID=UPI0026DAA3FB|nr:hypothetical protein [Corynebacterium sp.]MDO5076776.1 hypothetical protein [Corynebacterium sp.]